MSLLESFRTVSLIMMRKTFLQKINTLYHGRPEINWTALLGHLARMPILLFSILSRSGSFVPIKESRIIFTAFFYFLLTMPKLFRAFSCTCDSLGWNFNDGLKLKGGWPEFLKASRMLKLWPPHQKNLVWILSRCQLSLFRMLKKCIMLQSSQKLLGNVEG